MRTVNMVVLVGHVGAPPEVRTLTSGKQVAQVSLATGREWKDRETQELRKSTQWHRLILWEKLSELAQQYIRKGSKIYVRGEIEYRSYMGQDNVTRYVTEIKVEELSLLGDPVAPGRGQASGDGGRGAPAPSGYDDFEAPPQEDGDDLPF